MEQVVIFGIAHKIEAHDLCVLYYGAASMIQLGSKMRLAVV